MAAPARAERWPEPKTAAPPTARASYRAVLSGAYVWTTLAILAATVIASMDSYIVNTSMPRVLGELGQPEFYAWVASAFILGQVVGLALGGALRDRLGLRAPFLLTVAAFGAGSLLCAFAPSMGLLVLSRAVQGLAGGGLSAVAFAAAAGYPEALRLRMFSLISGAWGVIALGAPLLGGLITDTLGWRWIFFVNVPICILVFLLGRYALPASASTDRRRPLPVLSALLLALTVAGLTAAPSANRQVGLGLLVIGLAAAFLYARQERRAEVPIVPRETWLGRGAVGSSMLASMFYTGSYIGSGVFLPLYLVELRGVSSTEAGLVLSIGGFMWTAGSLVASNRGTGPWPMRLVIGGALLISLAGLSISLQAALGSLPLPLIYVAWGMAGFGVGLAMLHLMNWAIVFSPAAHSGAVSGAVQTARMLGSAAGGALLGAVLNAIGSDPAHLQTAVTSIFGVVCVVALFPATLGRPKVSER
jgi:MFS family permease